MNTFVNIFRYNFKKQIKSNAYRAVTIIMLLVIIGGFGISKFINTESDPINIIAVDDTGYFNDIESWNKELKNSKIELSETILTEKECKQKVLKEEKMAIIRLEKDENEKISMKIYDHNVLSAVDLQILQGYAKSTYEYIYGKTLGITDEELTQLCNGVESEIVQVDTSFEDVYLVAYCLLLLLVLSIMMYGSQVAGEITYAKTNRVMELLLTSASPMSIFLGITLSIGLAGLLQLGIILGVTACSFQIIKPDVLVMSGLRIDFSVLTIDKIIIYLLFFIFSYLLYAVLNAGIGSLVSKNEDIMVAVLPTTILSCIQMFTGLFAIASPNALSTRIFSYIPFTAAGTMVMGYFTGGIGISKVIISLIILLISLIVISFYCIQIFLNGVIYYGNFNIKTLMISKKDKNK